ncbi:MAG: LysR family transcriptional regulator [Acetobacteraceae bacterium]|nr:LysR family transcriptional regulator [Acetobacteraceae bacterium]
MATASPPWDLYRTFLAVLDEGSLSGAARSLSLTQPTAGRHIEALETALGAPLFTRSPGGLRPTEAARALEPDLRAMDHAARSALRRVPGATDAIAGAVRITASDVVGAEVLPSILRDLMQVHPQLVVELALSNRNEDLLRREADIAVRMAPPAQSALLSRKVGMVRIGPYAHRTYLERRGTPSSVAALADHVLIGFARRPSIDPARIEGAEALLASGFAFRTDSDLAGLAALRAGIGVGFCQAPLAARDPDLVPLHLGALEFDLGMWIVMHEDLKGERRMRVVFDALVEGLRLYLDA